MWFVVYKQTSELYCTQVKQNERTERISKLEIKMISYVTQTHYLHGLFVLEFNDSVGWQRYLPKNLIQCNNILQMYFIVVA